ncbi:MAG: response regulator [Gemmatimonadaceae bacterium]|nr:response regulator [Gemmatimonadaceae bacterium]
MRGTGLGHGPLSGRLALAARASALVALAVIVLRRVVPGQSFAAAGSVALGVAVVLLLVGLTVAGAAQRGIRRSFYIGVAAATAAGAIALGHDIVAYVIPKRVPEFPNPGLWTLIVGVNPTLAATFALVVGQRSARRGLRLGELLDVVLVATAAAIVAILLAQLSPWPIAGANAEVSSLLLLWRAGMIAAILLAALLLATRAEIIGARPASMLVSGTAVLEMAHTVIGRQVLATGHVDAVAADPWWALAVLVYALSLPPAIITGEYPVVAADDPADSGERSREERGDNDGVRSRAVIVAILITAAAAVDLGMSHEREVLLSIGIAGFSVVLAIRAAMVLEAERAARAALARSVRAERELSATLERAVEARTAELAEAQRVLQRMWTLGQQISLELNPTRVLTRFVEAVVDVVSADGGALALMTEAGPLGLLTDDGKLRIPAAIGISASLAGHEVTVRDSALGRAIRTGRPWMHEDASGEPGLLYEPPDAPLGVRGVLIVPIHRRGDRIGAVAVVMGRPRVFTQTEIERVEALADLLAMTLSNAELVESLRQAEWRFRTLFRAAPDVVLTVLQSGRVRETNDAVRAVTSLEPSQVIGRILWEIVVPEDQQALAAAIARAIEGDPSRCEVRVALDGAPTRVVAFAASRLPEADPPAALVIGRDVTAERDMRARLVESERLAAVGELVAGVAHEVNNPLSSISAFAQLLLRDPTLPAAHRDSIEVIRAETGRASQVVKDLLAFARRSEHRRAPLDLNELVERTLRLRSFQLGDAHIALELDLAPDVAAVVGDARQLQQVVLNLVTNAVQAMAPLGGGILRIATRPLPGSVSLEVSDTGPGIPAAARPHVFEPFFTTKREGEGTGLGLSVSYGIVSAHGGSIGVAHTSERGTRMVVSLPAAPEVAPAPRVPSVAGGATRSALAGLRLLVVEDEEMLRQAIESFGALRGFEVVTAADGAAALRALEAASVDAVVCDLRMAGMDGIALHEILRRDRPALAARTVFMTGDVVGNALQAATASRQPVLVKPFALDKLEEVVAAMVREQSAALRG